MIPIKIQCACGQRYAFEAEPVNGTMPHAVKCPVCGADGTAQANAIIAISLGAPTAPAAGMPQPPAIPPAVPPQPGPSPGQPAAPGGTGTARRLPLGRTAASNPARLKVDWGKALASFPQPLFLALVPMVIGIYGLATGQVPAVLFVIGPVVYLLAVMVVIHLKFARGDVCPAVVIAENPWLVAVAADMGTDGSRSRPAVKIIRQPLGRMTGGPPRIGMRLAAAALYKRARHGEWDDFMPTVVNCMSNDPAQIDYVFHSITETDWQMLDASLKRVSDKRAGLYKLWGSNYGRRLLGAQMMMAGNIRVLIMLAAVVVGIVLGLKHRQDRGTSRRSGSSFTTTTRSDVPPSGAPPVAAEPVPEVVDQLPEPETVEIPDTGVAGAILGEGFRYSEAKAFGTGLTLRQLKGLMPQAYLTISSLPVEPGSGLAGKHVVIKPRRGAVNPAVILYQGNNSKIVTDHYVLRLDFGELKNGKLPGRIYFEGTGVATRISGSFVMTER